MMKINIIYIYTYMYILMEMHKYEKGRMVD